MNKEERLKKYILENGNFFESKTEKMVKDPNSENKEILYSTLKIKKWRYSNIEKWKAHKLVYTNIRNRNLKKDPCVICGNEKSEAHHEDYSKPLDIMWLCKKHHYEHHVNIRKALKNND